MKTVRLAAGVVNQTPLAWQENAARIRKVLREARDHKVDLVCFPELTITGYGCDDMFLHPDVAKRAASELLALLPDTKDLIALMGLPILYEGNVYNAMAIIQNGRILGLHPKKILPREGVHYENRWFTAASRGLAEKVRLGHQDVPFGDFHYEFGSFSFGLDLCEEAWQRDFRNAAAVAAGAELILNPSVSHFALGKYHVRETLMAENSRDLGVAYFHVNTLGNESGRTIYDGGAILAMSGAVVARSRRFSFAETRLVPFDTDLLSVSRKSSTQLVAPLPMIAGAEVHPTEKQPSGLEDDRVHFFSHKGEWCLNSHEEFLSAVTLGLFDYARKSHAKGFTLSLSGGCDSSVIAVLVAQMAAMVVAERGIAYLCETFAVSSENATVASVLKRILSTLYQATENSSETTRHAAEKVAQAVHAHHGEVDVQDVIEAYIKKAGAWRGRELAWSTDDLALQNIQARARAPMVWLLANLSGNILLTTSNRSEAAVGYATMDGDAAGGLAPIGGIDKDFLRRWLQWAEKDCRWGFGPIAALSEVNAQEPTAELRPSSAGQTDEKDLMPYAVLNQIETLFVLEKMTPVEIWRRLKESEKDYRADALKQYVLRFFKMWSASQWKRERYAPSFHLDRYGIDPKTSFRFPILSNSFVAELKDLEKA